MLSDIPAMATLPVRSLAAARPFYEQTLGLEPVETGDPRNAGYRTGSGSILVYESAYAGTNKGTALCWALGDRFDEVVRDLRARGVTFERYPMPETTEQDGVYSGGGMRVAWFKDPDGNIINIGDFRP